MTALPKLFVVLILALASLPAASVANAAADDVAVKDLANGLRVIVKPDLRAPVVVSMVWYRIGSVDEQGGVTGVAHVLEHMMFKGTKADATTPLPAATTPAISRRCTSPHCRCRSGSKPTAWPIWCCRRKSLPRN
jgi:Insulinase (Peptidase family M16)